MIHKTSCTLIGGRVATIVPHDLASSPAQHAQRLCSRANWTTEKSVIIVVNAQTTKMAICVYSNADGSVRKESRLSEMGQRYELRNVGGVCFTEGVVHARCVEFEALTRYESHEICAESSIPKPAKILVEVNSGRRDGNSTLILSIGSSDVRADAVSSR